MSAFKHFLCFSIGVAISAVIISVMVSCEPQPCITDMECEARHGR